MSSDFAIRIRNVSKHYLMFERPEDRLKQMIVPRLQRAVGQEPKRYFRDFAALSDISFDVMRGETIGIIGRNGCGKSTLLQVVCGTLQPSSGTVEVNGRIAALLELGAGFNPEFTGRDNVFLNAAILGLSRSEIEARFDDIARFADIGMFIDQPVKTYSSGMFVRLAFAVAINVDPDILVVDEALAVGDEAFQRKCFARIEDIKDMGGTILFVSHGAQTIVQLCDRAMLLDRGEVILEGYPKTVVSQYQRFVNLPAEEAEPVREAIKAMDGWKGAPKAKAQGAGQTRSESPAKRAPLGHQETLGTGPGTAAEDDAWFDPSLVSETPVEYESQGAYIRDVRITTLDGRQVNVIRNGRQYVLRYRVDFAGSARRVAFGFTVSTPTGIALAGAGTSKDRNYQIPKVVPGNSVDVSFVFDSSFNSGIYFLTTGVSGVEERGERKFLHRIIDPIQFKVVSDDTDIATGYFGINPRAELRMIDDFTDKEAVEQVVER